MRPAEPPDLVVVLSPPASRGGPAVPLRFAASASAPERGPSALIGRDRACEVCIDDPAVSRAHARVDVRRSARAGAFELVVTDQGGPGGTHLHGQALAPLCPTVVEDGHALLLAGWSVTLRLDAARGLTSDSQLGDRIPLSPEAEAAPRAPPEPPRADLPRAGVLALRTLPWVGLAAAAYALYVTLS